MEATRGTPGMREMITLETTQMKMQSLAIMHQIQSKACGGSSLDYSHIGDGPAKNTINSEKSSGLCSGEQSSRIALLDKVNKSQQQNPHTGASGGHLRPQHTSSEMCYPPRALQWGDSYRYYPVPEFHAPIIRCWLIKTRISITHAVRGTGHAAPEDCFQHA